MTEGEWTTVAAMLRHWWPGEFTDEAADAYRVLLDAHEAGRVVEVLAVRARRGDTFRPSGAEISGALRPDTTTGRGSSAALVAALRDDGRVAAIRRRRDEQQDIEP